MRLKIVENCLGPHCPFENIYVPLREPIFGVIGSRLFYGTG
jgi:hypothetical protein